MNSQPMNGPFAALAMVVALSGLTTSATALPRTLECTLTDVETSGGGAQFDRLPNAQNRPLVVIFDEEQGELKAEFDGRSISFDNVSISQTVMNGSTASHSLGVDRSSWRMVFQNYSPQGNRAEFGRCRLREEAKGG